MADNVTLNAGAGGDTIAADDISGVKIQRVKVVIGADGTNDGDVSGSNPIPTSEALGGTWSDNEDSISATSATTVLSANSSRINGYVFNQSTSVTVRVREGATATATGFPIPPLGTFPVLTTGLVSVYNPDGSAVTVSSVEIS